MSNYTSLLHRILSEFRGRALFVALGCLICQMGLGLTYVRTGIAPELIEGLGITDRGDFSWAATPQLIFQSLASPLVGILAVRLGASRVLAISAALFAFVAPRHTGAFSSFVSLCVGNWVSRRRWRSRYSARLLPHLDAAAAGAGAAAAFFCLPPPISFCASFSASHSSGRNAPSMSASVSCGTGGVSRCSATTTQRS